MSDIKYLYVEFTDFWRTENSIVHMGVAIPPKSRVVRIALTEEQLIMLIPKKIGSSGLEDKHETVRLIGVQDE